MNILHISRTMGQGGAEKVVYQLCTNCKNQKMFVASTGGDYVKRLNECNIEHFAIPDIDKKNPFSMLKTLYILNKIIKQNDIDIIHSHHRMASFYSRILCIFNKNIKRVYTAHNVFFNKIKLLRFSLKNSKIVAVGDGVKNNLVDIYNIDPSNISTIYNSIEVPDVVVKANDDIFKENKIFIGGIGRLSEQKGFDIFIKALNEVIKNNKNVIGIIVGDGELKESLKNLVSEYKLEKNILFLGYRTDVFSIIKSLDFVVLSSRWEGFPLTPIEVFSQSKSIIATNITGNNEIVKDEVNGLLFEKDNYDELAKKIKMMLDVNFRKNLEKNAYNDFKKKYSFLNFVSSYEKLYDSLK